MTIDAVRDNDERNIKGAGAEHAVAAYLMLAHNRLVVDVMSRSNIGFDLAVYARTTGRFCRLQVKYHSETDGGVQVSPREFDFLVVVARPMELATNGPDDMVGASALAWPMWVIPATEVESNGYVAKPWKVANYHNWKPMLEYLGIHQKSKRRG